METNQSVLNDPLQDSDTAFRENATCFELILFYLYLFAEIILLALYTVGIFKAYLVTINPMSAGNWLFSMPDEIEWLFMNVVNNGSFSFMEAEIIQIVGKGFLAVAYFVGLVIFIVHLFKTIFSTGKIHSKKIHKKQNVIIKVYARVKADFLYILVLSIFAYVFSAESISTNAILCIDLGVIVYLATLVLLPINEYVHKRDGNFNWLNFFTRIGKSVLFTAIGSLLIVFLIRPIFVDLSYFFTKLNVMNHASVYRDFLESFLLALPASKLALWLMGDVYSYASAKEENNFGPARVKTRMIMYLVYFIVITALNFVMSSGILSGESFTGEMFGSWFNSLKTSYLPVMLLMIGGTVCAIVSAEEANAKFEGREGYEEG